MSSDLNPNSALIDILSYVGRRYISTYMTCSTSSLKPETNTQQRIRIQQHTRTERRHNTFVQTVAHGRETRDIQKLGIEVKVEQT